MLDPTLTLKKDDLKARVAANLGWGRGAAADDPPWDSQQEFYLKDFVDSGYRRFLKTPPVPGVHPGAYEWSFLRPTADLVLAAGESLVPLPPDFGGIEGPITVLDADGNGLFEALRPGADGAVLAAFASGASQTGWPQLAAVRPVKGTTHLHGQRLELHVYPAADAAYTLRLSYYLHPHALSDASPYAYGGPGHSETILESCLAVAEERLDGVSYPKGPHAVAFMRELAASILADQRLKPQHLGYNGDRDGRGWRRADWRTGYTVTFDGSAP